MIVSVEGAAERSAGTAVGVGATADGGKAAVAQIDVCHEANGFATELVATVDHLGKAHQFVGGVNFINTLAVGL